MTDIRPSPEPSAGRLRTALASVFGKCMVLIGAVSLLVSALISVQTNALTVRTMSDGMIALAELRIGNAAQNLGGFVRFGKVDGVLDELGVLLAADDGTVVSALVTDAAGAIVAQAGEDAGTKSAGLQTLAQAAFRASAPARATEGFDFAYPVYFGDGGTPVGAVAMSVSDAITRAAILGKQLTIALIAGGVLLVALILAGIALWRMLIRPLRDVGSTMSRVACAELDMDVPCAQRGDEIGRIARDLSAMLDALKTARSAEDRRMRAAEDQLFVVGKLSEGLRALSSGDLSRTVDAAFPDEYAQLKSDLNATVDGLNDMLCRVRQAARDIRGEAGGITAQSADLARRTETQAATLEQTAAAIAELTESVRSASAGTQAVETTIEEAREDADQSEKVVKDAVDAMRQIEESSRQISTIVAVIDDIAFQTNLLALNAGVEAARAGDAGRGFAVVASEVRALAQRSSDAAKEIKTLINGSAAQVGRGVDLVARTGTALAGIVERVNLISVRMKDIASGSAEQAAGLAQINTGVNHLDQMTQRNAAMVAESASATQALNTEAERLADLIARFRLAGQAGESAEAPAPHPAEQRVA
ncbi:MAG: methyl-accepting chemotaxis protein [Rhodobacteraceae bacterium]|nr:methyl-accepting chemotaxis protein [Paracoccaceae bacterium]